MAREWENLEALIEYPKGGVLSKHILRDEKLEATLFCMAGGTSISDHTSTKEGLVYIIEGRGTFNLGGNKIGMSSGVMIRMGKNAVHSLSAEENTSFLLLLFPGGKGRDGERK